jgi:phage tail sheath protein FI
MNYAAPGVYVEEVSSGPKPIQAVGTRTAAFLGKAPEEGAHLGEAIAVDNWSQFVREFCGDKTVSTPLAHAVYGFFQNRGSRCYVLNLETDSLTGGGKSRAGLDLLETLDEVKLVAAPGFTSPVHHDALLSHCENMRDRFAIMDGPSKVEAVEHLTRVGTVLAEGEKPEPGQEKPGLAPRRSDGGYGAFYFPWLVVKDQLDKRTRMVTVPPSGHVAGIYARSDATRGVHKAPANEMVYGAVNVSYAVSRAEHDLLNPAGVNCIRLFSREGVVLYGARTVAKDPEWKYVNVRRLFNMVEESIGLSTRHVVFEPNDHMLWNSIVRDVRAFLFMLYRDGALMGRTPEEAFFVQCDEETNPPESIDLGMVVTRIGIAPVKPAEFVVFRIGQSSGGTKVETEKGGGNA